MSASSSVFTAAPITRVPPELRLLSDQQQHKCNAAESSRNHPCPPVHRKIVFHETGSWCQKVWGPLLYGLWRHTQTFLDRKHHFSHFYHSQVSLTCTFSADPEESRPWKRWAGSIRKGGDGVGARGGHRNDVCGEVPTVLSPWLSVHCQEE